MIKNVLFKEKNLTVISSTEESKNIDVGARILRVVFTQTHVVALLNWTDLNDTEYHNRNIVCFDERGQLLWRIVNQDTLSPSKNKTYYSWSSLVLKNDGCIKVGTISGMEVDVDINSGKFISRGEYTK